MRFFFYGTLLDETVRRRVLGPAAATLTMRRARLEGWRVVRPRGFPFTIVRRCPGRLVEGEVAEGVGRGGARLLDRYEGALYGRRRVWVTAGRRRLAAFVYAPRPTAR